MLANPESMKKLIHLSILLLLLTANNCFAGENDQVLKFKVDYCGDNKQPFMNYGIQYEIYLNPKLSFAYNLSLGYIPNEGLCFQTGSTQSFGFILLALNDSEHDYLSTVGFISMILPNEISYTARENGNMAFRPYIKPLDIALFPNTYSCIYEPFDLSTEIGLKLRFRAKDFEISPQIGMKYFYYSRRSDLIAGISAGIRF
jgi:hypothetical protein